MSKIKASKHLIATLPEWAQAHLANIKSLQGQCVQRADNAERQVRDMAAEMTRLRRLLAERDSK